MDDDGFTVQGRKRGGRPHESGRDRDIDSFHRDNTRYAGSEEEFERAHARSYGRDEGLGVDGSHPGPGKPHFPEGSARERVHAGYSVSTEATKTARGRYVDGLGAAVSEFNKMTEDEVEYYREVSDGLRPDQHESLYPRAERWADSSYSMATGRENFLKAYPHGYHSRQEQNDHYRLAEHAFREHKKARNGIQHTNLSQLTTGGTDLRDKYRAISLECERTSFDPNTKRLGYEIPVIT